MNSDPSQNSDMMFIDQLEPRTRDFGGIPSYIITPNIDDPLIGPHDHMFRAPRPISIGLLTRGKSASGPKVPTPDMEAACTWARPVRGPALAQRIGITIGTSSHPGHMDAPR